MANYIINSKPDSDEVLNPYGYFVSPDELKYAFFSKNQNLFLLFVVIQKSLMHQWLVVENKNGLIC
jgi:hypothetical protein